MNKRKSIVPLMIFVLCFLIGFGAYNTYYYFENIYSFNIGSISKSNIQKIENSNVWNTIENHYTKSLGVKIETYEDIYKTVSLNDYADKLLKPYYSQYGYDCVIASGLKSNSKLANVYSYEKCCELIGEKKLNKNSLLSYLKNVSIDEKIYSQSEKEQEYIDYAKDRLDLAVALFSGSVHSNMIARHSSSSDYCWIANGLCKKTRLRLYTKDGYLTAKNHYIDSDSKIEFVSKNIIKIISSNPYALYLDDDIIMYNINSMINMELVDDRYPEATAYDIVFTGHIVSGKIRFEHLDILREFTLDLTTEKIEIKIPSLPTSKEGIFIS